MSDPAIEPGAANLPEDGPGNTVATIGLILTVIAGLLCSVLFAAASRLPDEGVASDGPAAAEPELIDSELAARQLQVLLIASATAVLNLVGLILSTAGLFVPHRPRAVAICGTILSLALFAGVFGVMGVGALLTPGANIMAR
ncbi:MAG: hypothetical protein ABGZ35_15005 [Planctomycetaceae bacterium]